MIKKIIFICFLFAIVVYGLFFIKNNKIKNTKQIDDNKIYFFSQYGCPHCNDALDFIAKNFDNVDNFKIIDINANKENLELFVKYAEKYDLDKSTLGTPLICIGDKYFLGWNNEYEKDFIKYANEFFKIDKLKN